MAGKPEPVSLFDAAAEAELDATTTTFRIANEDVGDVLILNMRTGEEWGLWVANDGEVVSHRGSMLKPSTAHQACLLLACRAAYVARWHDGEARQYELAFAERLVGHLQ